jgi:predicted phosphodiesterase
MVSGNHDTDAARFDDLHFSQVREISKDAYDGIKYSHSCLTKGQKDWLKSLPRQKLIEDPDLPFWISHYSPDFCTLYGYILSPIEASISMEVLKKKDKGNLFFFGHSHLPTFIVDDPEDQKHGVSAEVGRQLENDTYTLEDDRYYLVNPGTIGQPRGSGITSYLILDTKERSIRWEGFEYDYKAAQKAVFAAGYSKAIAHRLDVNYDEKQAKKAAKKARCKAKQKQADLNKQ